MFFKANDDKQLTVCDLVNTTSEFLGDSEEPVFTQRSLSSISLVME